MRNGGLICCVVNKQHNVVAVVFGGGFDGSVILGYWEMGKSKSLMCQFQVSLLALLCQMMFCLCCCSPIDSLRSMDQPGWFSLLMILSHLLQMGSYRISIS